MRFSNEFYNAGSIDAGVVFATSCLVMLLWMKVKPQGIAYTYCWLWCCGLSLLATNDARALAACTGIGVNTGWYVVQMMYRELWSKLLPYWEDYLPRWSIGMCVRFGDICLHIVPCCCFAPYLKLVDFRIAVYAFLLERWYFILVEKQFIGNGSTCNNIYDFRPRLPSSVFITSQCISCIAIFAVPITNIDSWVIRRFLQLIAFVAMASLFVLRTDRTEMFEPFIHSLFCKRNRGKGMKGSSRCSYCDGGSDVKQLTEGSAVSASRERSTLELIATGGERYWSRADLSLALDELFVGMQSLTDQWVEEFGNVEIEGLRDRLTCAYQNVAARLSLMTGRSETHPGGIMMTSLRQKGDETEAKADNTREIAFYKCPTKQPEVVCNVGGAVSSVLPSSSPHPLGSSSSADSSSSQPRNDEGLTRSAILPDTPTWAKTLQHLHRSFHDATPSAVGSCNTAAIPRPYYSSSLHSPSVAVWATDEDLQSVKNVKRRRAHTVSKTIPSSTSTERPSPRLDAKFDVSSLYTSPSSSHEGTKRTASSAPSVPAGSHSEEAYWIAAAKAFSKLVSLSKVSKVDDDAAAGVLTSAPNEDNAEPNSILGVTTTAWQ